MCALLHGARAGGLFALAAFAAIAGLGWLADRRGSALAHEEDS